MRPARASSCFHLLLAACTTPLLAACGGPLSHVATDPKWLDPSTSRGSAVLAPRADEIAPLRVAIYGDTRDNREVHRAVVDAMTHAHPDLVVFTGDALGCLPVGHMPDYGLATYFIPFWPQIHRGYPWASLATIVPFPALVHETIGSAFLPPRDDFGFNGFLEDTAPLRIRDRVPFLFAPGNHDLYHDVDKAEIVRLFGTDGHMYLSLDIAGRYRFIILDTGSDLAFDDDPMPVGGAQLKWLEARLADAEARNMRTIVAMHMPPFSSGAEDGPVPWVEERVVKGIFDRHRVDLVACGHSHAYERIQRKGFGGRIVNYVVTGGGGAPFHHEEVATHGQISFAAETAHYVLVDMTPFEMKVRMIPVTEPGDSPPAWALAGKTPDEFTIDLRP